LNCHLTVITADGKLVLGKRTDGVDAAKHQWGASLGESIDGDLDLDDFGRINPLKTIRRALSASDELGLDEDVVQSAEIKIVGLTTEWETLGSDLITIVKLPRTGAAEVRESHSLKARDGVGEIRELDFVDFKLESCVPLMIRGSHVPHEHPMLAGELYGTARLAILTTLMHEFGHDKVKSYLKDTAHSRTS
jgi:hypothetical protein